ncbi:MAG: hypothetical protein ACI4PO_08235 [Faecousia sp.]
MKTKFAASALTAAMLLSAVTVTAFADESYSFTAGQQRSQSRNSIYAQAMQIEDEEERKAFLAEHGITDIQWSEEAAAAYSYVGGRLRGSMYQSDDNADSSAYGYVTGQQRGSSYHR